MPIGAAGDPDARGLVAEFALERLDVIRPQLARHEHEIEVALREFDRPQAAGVGRRDRQRDAGIVRLELVDPLLRERDHHVGRRALEAAGDRYIGARPIRRQRRIEHRLEHFGRRELASTLPSPFGFLRRLRLVGRQRGNNPLDHGPSLDRLRVAGYRKGHGAGAERESSCATRRVH